jgi:hypothetical protein
MYGTMKLVLQKFDNASLVPEGAVFERGGRTCMFVVRDGKAHLVPVRVQLDDGTRANVVILAQEKDPKTGQVAEVEHELTGSEAIIPCGQGELADGQLVQATPSEW